MCGKKTGGFEIFFFRSIGVSGLRDGISGDVAVGEFLNLERACEKIGNRGLWNVCIIEAFW